MRRDEPRRHVRLQAGPDRRARQVARLVDERPDVFFGQVGRLRKPDWEFRQRGQSGLWISDLFPHLAEVADELTVIRSMVAETSNHTPATFQENSGFRLNGFPALGAWLSYGLGSESDDLPAFVVIPDAREFPAGGAINWTNGFLPARHQGVVIRPAGRADRRPVPGPADRRRAPSRAARELGRGDEPPATSTTHARRRRPRRPHPRLRAGRADADVGPRASPTSTASRPRRCALYGVDRPETADFGRACLLARRLLERGVRFVQLFSGGTFGSPRRNWDGHEDMKAEPRPGGPADRPARRRPAPRPPPPRPARRHARAVHDRVRPDAVHPVGRRRRRHGPRPQPVRLHASGWPAPA